jgi:hypothetical protein
MIKYLPPPRLWALVEAVVAALCVFFSASVEQAAAIMAITAVLTGETVNRKVQVSAD